MLYQLDLISDKDNVSIEVLQQYINDKTILDLSNGSWPNAIAFNNLISELKTSDAKNKEEEISDFCYKYFIKKNVLDKAYKSYKKIKDMAAQIKDIPLDKNDDIINKDLEERILFCLNYGFDINTAKLNSDKETYTTSTIKYAKLNQNNFQQFQNQIGFSNHY